MAAPTNSGEWDMVTEDLYSDLSSFLVSPRWSPLRLTPSSPRHFLPSSSSMVTLYPLQNQEHPASNMSFEESEETMMSCFYFPPSPTYFPLCPQMPTIFFVSNRRDITLPLCCQRLLEDKSGALHLLNTGEGEEIAELLFGGLISYCDNNYAEEELAGKGAVPKDMELLVNRIFEVDNEVEEGMLRRINWLENHDEDMVDQPVSDNVFVVHQLIQNRGGELEVILGGGVLTVNGIECRESQGLPTTPETLLICRAETSCRVWVRHSGQWVIELRVRCNFLNNGSFTTVEDAISAYEFVLRFSGWVNPTDYPGLFENENRSKLPLQLPLPSAQGNDEIEAVRIGSEGTGDCVMADAAWLNSECLGKWKTNEKKPGGERRCKKTKRVRIAIPLEAILQTKGMRRKEAAKHLGVSISKLKSSCRDYGIRRWPPRNEHKLIRQPLPNEISAIDEEEEFPQLTSHNGPFDQALTATIDTNSVDNEIPLSQFLPIAQQENLDVGFGNDEEEAIGMEVEGTWEGVMEEAQLNPRCSGIKGKKKVNTLGEEGGNNITTGVRIAISMEDILKVKGMSLDDAAAHLEVSRSTLKRACREYGIKRWRPHKEHELINQTHPNESPAVLEHELISQTRTNIQTQPNEFRAVEVELISHTRPNESPAVEHELISQTRPNESPAVVDQEQTQQLNFDAFLPTNQVSTTMDTKTVKLKARYEGSTITFRLSWPLQKVDLEREVKKRLPLEAGTYNIKFKDEDDELVLIACDDDLEECIHSSNRLGSRCPVLFLNRSSS